MRICSQTQITPHVPAVPGTYGRSERRVTESLGYWRSDPTSDPESGLPNNRFNDGKCDPAGRFWAGTLSLDRTPEVCSLYRMDKDFSVRRVLDRLPQTESAVRQQPLAGGVFRTEPGVGGIPAYEFAG